MKYLITNLFNRNNLDEKLMNQIIFLELNFIHSNWLNFCLAFRCKSLFDAHC